MVGFGCFGVLLLLMGRSGEVFLGLILVLVSSLFTPFSEPSFLYKPSAFVSQPSPSSRALLAAFSYVPN